MPKGVKGFQPGVTSNPKGRGNKPNKITAETRDKIDSIVSMEYKAGRVNKALQRLYEENPSQYIAAIDKMCEYIIPKLSRAEVTGEGGGAIDVNIKTVKTLSDKELTELRSKLA